MSSAAVEKQEHKHECRDDQHGTSYSNKGALTHIPVAELNHDTRESRIFTGIHIFINLNHDTVALSYPPMADWNSAWLTSPVHFNVTAVIWQRVIIDNFVHIADVIPDQEICFRDEMRGVRVTAAPPLQL